MQMCKTALEGKKASKSTLTEEIYKYTKLLFNKL